MDKDESVLLRKPTTGTASSGGGSVLDAARLHKQQTIKPIPKDSAARIYFMSSKPLLNIALAVNPAHKFTASFRNFRWSTIDKDEAKIVTKQVVERKMAREVKRSEFESTGKAEDDS